jgi:hypothetical protein
MGRKMIMKNKWNVLIFPSGTENGLEILKSLRYCKEVNLYSGTSKSINHSEFVYNEVNYISDIRNSEWINELNKVIEESKIDCVYPANSFVIDALLSNRKLINCEIILPDEEVVRLTRSKRATINVLKSAIDTPYLFSREEIKEEIFPIFMKPDKGYGSQGAEVVKSLEHFNRKMKDDKEQSYILQEYLPGKEYSVDCFSDGDKLLFSRGRSRERVRMGTSMHSELVDGEIHDSIVKIAEQINNIIPIKGAWFFQLKEDKDGKLKLLEIDIRIAGTMGLNRVRGINFPLLTIYQHYGLSVDLLVNEFNVVIDRCLHNKYSIDLEYDKVFIDLDDTIIMDKVRVNLDVIRLMYQWINKGIKIILVSKNLEHDKISYLSKFKIRDLFDDIFWLEESESKASYIKSYGYDNSIFIDDSFSQRKEVRDILGIPTFDLSMIELLFDYRY